jgi:hypothetical protein
LGEDYVVDFLKIKKDVKESSYTVLTVYDSGCLGCNNFILSDLENSQKEYEESPFYLIVSAATADQIDRFLSDYKKIRNFTNVVIDSTGIINKMTKINDLKNPRLTIVRENKVILDSVYDSFHIASDLYTAMRESLNLKD